MLTHQLNAGLAAMPSGSEFVKLEKKKKKES